MRERALKRPTFSRSVVESTSRTEGMQRMSSLGRVFKTSSVGVVGPGFTIWRCHDESAALKYSRMIAAEFDSPPCSR